MVHCRLLLTSPLLPSSFRFWTFYGLFVCLFVCFKLAKIHNLLALHVCFLQFLQGKLLAKISMKALEKVADSVLALTIPDERTISFTAGQLSMTVGRYSLQRLSGLEIKAGKGRFILPSKSQLLLAGVNKTSFVDVQVGFLPFRQISIQVFFGKYRNQSD